VGVDAVVAIAGGDELPVRLARERAGGVPARAHRRRHLAGPVEARVERAVRVVAGEREVGVNAVVTGAGDNELAVGLPNEPVDVSIPLADSGGDLAARSESRIEPARRRLGGGNEQNG